MAIVRSGILGNVRGKVAGVVGSQWKDKNYLREYVKPANPQTAAQVVQRDLMASSVVFAKQAVGQVFNVYTDPFQKSMSGFNFFIKQNIALFLASPTYASMKLTEGPLSSPIILTATYNTANGLLETTWDKNLGSNGSDSDKIFWVVYDKANLIMYFATAETTRSTETNNKTIPTGLTATDLVLYLFAIKYVGSVLNMISISDYFAVTVP